MEEAPAVPRSSTGDNLPEYFANSCDGFFLLNVFMQVCSANDTMQAWLGIQSHESECIALRDIIGAEEIAEIFLQNCRLAFSGVPAKFEFQLHTPNNVPQWLEVTLQRVPGAKLMGIARDIDDYKQEIVTLQSKFGQDELTRLLTRNELLRVLGDLPAPFHGRERALLVIELEHFNVVNDMCGLAAGDRLLTLVADALRLLTGKWDIAARIGGKKFAMLCRDSGMDAAYTKACEIRDRLTAIKYECCNQKFEVGVGIGFTLICGDGGAGQHAALSEADSACHFARNMGHNRIHAYSLNGNNAYRQHESEWISRIASAFENDRFQLFYQNIQKLENIGGHDELDEHHEILLRMLDENGEHVTPNEFMPAAEKYNLMPLIDRWVIRTLFARNADLWRSAYSLQQVDAALPMSLCCINISGASLNDDYFPEFLRDQVALHKVPPQAVCFEITETVAVNDLEKASRLIRTLRADGFRFALDDFGSGMSSFSYLQSLPVDFLKIDGSLVHNIDVNKVNLCMVEAINRIAQEMGIKTIAEFVKSQQVKDMLQAMGVNYVQGYCIHHPEPLL